MNPSSTTPEHTAWLDLKHEVMWLDESDPNYASLHTRERAARAALEATPEFQAEKLANESTEAFKRDQQLSVTWLRQTEAMVLGQMANSAGRQQRSRANRTANPGSDHWKPNE